MVETPGNVCLLWSMINFLIVEFSNTAAIGTAAQSQTLHAAANFQKSSLYRRDVDFSGVSKFFTTL